MNDPSQITHGCVRTGENNREQQRVGSASQKLAHGYMKSSKDWGPEAEQKETLRKEHRETKLTDTLIHACTHTAVNEREHSGANLIYTNTYFTYILIYVCMYI